MATTKKTPTRRTPARRVPAKQKHMGKDVARVIISCTDLPQFKRLVTFVEDVRKHAVAQDDDELKEILDVLAQDLTEKYRDG